MTRDRAFFALAGLAICFLAGAVLLHVFFKDASFPPPVSLSFQGARDGLAWLNHKGTLYPVDLAVIVELLFSCLGFLLGYLTELYWHRARLLLYPNPIDIHLRSQNVVHIVMPKMEKPAYNPAGPGGGHPPMPANAPLIAYGDAMAMSIIQGYLDRTYRGRRKKTIQFHQSNSLFDIHNKSDNILSIGGPAVNAFTLGHCKPDAGKFLIEKFGPADQWMFKDGHAAEPLKTKFKDGKPDGDVLEDYGAVLCVRSSAANRRQIVMLFGLNPFGTTAAAEVFIGAVQHKAHLKDFNQKLKDGKNAIAITKAHNIGILTFDSELIMVRDV